LRKVTKNPEVNIIYYIAEGGTYMKIVVIRSPKFISGILRAIFKIKKEEE